MMESQVVKRWKEKEKLESARQAIVRVLTARFPEQVPAEVVDTIQQHSDGPGSCRSFRQGAHHDHRCQRQRVAALVGRSEPAHSVATAADRVFTTLAPDDAAEGALSRMRRVVGADIAWPAELFTAEGPLAL